MPASPGPMQSRPSWKGVFAGAPLNEPDFAGSLSAVKRVCRRLDRERGPTAEDVAIPVETAPGEIAQVEFKYAGLRFDPERGVLRKSWIFLMTLGFSRRSFAELVFDQRAETWLSLHIQAFEYFGAVPRVIVPDNLKAAVVRAAFAIDDDPILNRSYRELAQHYGFQIDPTPPASPKLKGKVESGCRYLGSNFLAAWKSHDMPADRVALRTWLDGIANARVHQKTKRRPIELFEEAERAALLPLPQARWERVIWKKARMHRDSHVQIDGAFYSVPWRYLHQEVWPTQSSRKACRSCGAALRCAFETSRARPDAAACCPGWSNRRRWSRRTAGDGASSCLDSVGRPDAGLARVRSRTPHTLRLEVARSQQLGAEAQQSASGPPGGRPIGPGKSPAGVASVRERIRPDDCIGGSGHLPASQPYDSIAVLLPGSCRVFWLASFNRGGLHPLRVEERWLPVPSSGECEHEN
jgi:transposase